MSFDPCQVIDRLNELQQQLYNIQRIYQTPVSGFSYTIPATTHKLTSGVRGYLLLDTNGNAGVIAFRVFGDLTVNISSNVDLTGNTLYLF